MRQSGRQNLRQLARRRLAVCAIAAAWSGAACGGAALPAAGAPAQPIPAAGERWQEIRLAGTPAGSYHEQVEPAGAGTRTRQEMLMVINRLGAKVRIETRVETTEDAAGGLIAVHAVVSSSQQSLTVDGVAGAGGLELATRAGDRSYRRTLPVDGTLLGPVGAARRSREALHAAGDTVSYRTYAADAGNVALVTRTVLRAEPSAGTPALLVEERNDVTPGTVQVWLDAAGWPLGSAAQLPFGKVEMRLADRATAQRATAGETELPAESYERTLARSNIRLPEPRSLESVTLRLTQRRPDLGWPAFDGPGQRVLARTPTTLDLEIRRGGSATGSAAGPASADGGPAGPGVAALPAAADPALAPNALVQADDPEVVRLAQQVLDVAGAAGAPLDAAARPLDAARALQDWTAAHVEFDLGIALAPASEVARNRRGTCIAFAVLLAALERAAGIPARIAMGYAYVDGIWGGHAWTEVRIGRAWLPLDAALYAPGVADAARFQFGSYTGDDNLSAAIAAAAQAYGNLEVQVLAYTAAGRVHRVPAGAPGFTVAGDTYRNPWLGFALHKPAGSSFAKLDAIYPDATVVAVTTPTASVQVELVAPRGDRAQAVARLLAEFSPATGAAARPAALDGAPAQLVSSPDKVRMVAAVGNSLWVLTGTGAEAPRLLAQMATGWAWTPAD